MRYGFCFRRTVQVLTVAAALAMGSAAQAITVDYTDSEGQPASFEIDLEAFAPEGVSLETATMAELEAILRAALLGNADNAGLIIWALLEAAGCDTRACSDDPLVDPLDELLEAAADETGVPLDQLLNDYAVVLASLPTAAGGPAAGPPPPGPGPGAGDAAENPNQGSDS